MLIFSRNSPPPRFYHSLAPWKRSFFTGFTLLELLIVIGIVAILSTIVMVVMNPAEQLKKARDTERKNELQTLNKVLGLFQLENSTASMGTTTWVYVSLPDASSTCGSWSLPTLLPGYSQYACKPESTYLKLDGTGWIPLNFQSLSSGNPMSNLPIDPKNNSSYYYSYVPTNPYYLAANLEATTTVLALGGGSSPLETYILNDEFTTARSAGAVNGTSAEPTGETRTVVDTENKLSITGSQLSFAGGKTSPEYGDPGIWWPAVTRTAGKMLLSQLNFTNTTGHVRFGWDTDQTKGQPGSSHWWFESGQIDTPIANNGNYTASTNYYTANILRSTGAYLFIKGGTEYPNWTFFGSSGANSTNTLYPNIAGYSATVNFDNIRIPTSTWLPTPLAYDTFTRADGAIGSSETTGPDSQTTPSLAWTGGAISSNKNVITPTVGSELISDGGAESGTGSFANFSALTWERSAVDKNSGTYSMHMITDTSIRGTYLIEPGTVATNNWYLLSVYAKSISGNNLQMSGTGTNKFANMFPIQYFTGGTGIWTQKFVTARAITGSTWISNVLQSGAGTAEFYVDDWSVKPLTLSSLFSSVSTSDTDVIADANVTLTAGTQAGLVLNLDSTSSPANFIIVYHDGTSVKVDEAVAGVYTNKQTITVTYSAGATLRAIREGTKLRVYYNNALVGSELTMTANTNTKHGLFSTYSGNSFDNFTLWARGTGNEYADMPQ